MWCVKQLELSLESGKLNERRTAEVKRSLRILRNPDTPLIKLRQVMRTSFGDYRTKMAAEEKSAKLDDSRAKIMPGVVSTSNSSGSSVKVNFIKKAAAKTTTTNAAAAGGCEVAGTGTPFTFSFTIPGE